MGQRKGILNLKIHQGWPSRNPLVRDYLEAETHLVQFFNGCFRDPDAYRDKAREVDQRFHRDARERAVSFLLPPSEVAGRHVGGFPGAGGYFVTTGQQPGVFGGPLYTLYKALTAVRLARALEELLGKPVLPLFWINSEDHDWEEASHTHLLDPANEIRTFRLPEEDEEAPRPLHRIPLGPTIEETLEEFLQALPESEFRTPYLELLREAYPVGGTLPGGFHRTLQGLLAHLPILFVDGASSRLKAAALPVLFRELAEAERHEALLARVASHLEMEGYHIQVPVLEGGVNLFLDGPQGRDRLYRSGDGLRLNRSGTVLTREEVRERAQGDPTLLSPNVLLRPVVESALFPTLAYVAGPGELAYYAQAKELYEAHGLRMPVIVPRHSATLVEAKVGKVLDKFQLSIEALDRPFHEVAGEIARDEVPASVRRALGELRGAVGRCTGDLAKAVQEVDPTLKGPVNGARNASVQALDELERKILQAVKRRNETTLEQLEKAQRHLFPLGIRQERAVNPFYYLIRYGPEFIDALLDAFDVALGTDSA